MSSVFVPSAPSTQSGTLSVFDSDPSSPTTISLTGIGRALSFSSGSLSFGNENIPNTSNPLTITVTNLGTVAVNFSGVAVGGTNPGDFAIQANTCGVALGAATNCTVGVTFTPQASGARSATLSFTDNGGGSPQVATLAGNGVVGPALSFSPAYLSFGNENIPKTSNPSTITVTNAGTVAVNFSSIAVGGTNPGDFAIQTNTCGAALGAGTNCAVGVTFTPQAAGARSATVNFTDNGGASPQVLKLGGHGVAVLSSIAVTAANSSVAIGATQQFTATGAYTDGSSNNLTASATWGSSNTGIATVSNTSGSQGLATGAARGTATISATMSSVKGSTTLTVLTNTTAVVASNNNPSTFGQAVMFTATVSPSTATGTVQFLDGGNLIGMGTVSAGTASFGTSSLTTERTVLRSHTRATRTMLAACPRQSPRLSIK